MKQHENRAGRRFVWLDRLLGRRDGDEAARAETASRIARLEALNSLLHQVASTSNVTSLFGVLSSRIGDVVPCDRVAVALTDRGTELQLVVASSEGDDRQPEPQIHHFLASGTLIAQIADSVEPRIVGDLTPLAPAHLDANVLVSAGLRSAAFLPLTAESVTLGVLIVLSRRADGFTMAHVETLRPIADIVGVAFATQSLARALGRTQMAKDMAEVMFSLANEINGALQAIVGHCELLSREYHDPALQRDLAMVSRQALRATEVLAQVHGLAEARLQRANSVASMIEEARLEETAGRGADPEIGDLLKRS